jgi:hypothetical protein
MGLYNLAAYDAVPRGIWWIVAKEVYSQIKKELYQTHKITTPSVRSYMESLKWHKRGDRRYNILGKVTAFYPYNNYEG